MTKIVVVDFLESFYTIPTLRMPSEFTLEGRVMYKSLVHIHVYYFSFNLFLFTYSLYFMLNLVLVRILLFSSLFFFVEFIISSFSFSLSLSLDGSYTEKCMQCPKGTFHSIRIMVYNQRGDNNHVFTV